MDVEVKASLFKDKEQVKTLGNILNNQGIQFSITLLVSDDSKFGTIDTSTFSSIHQFGQFKECAFISNYNNVVEISWIDECYKNREANYYKWDFGFK